MDLSLIPVTISVEMLYKYPIKIHFVIPFPLSTDNVRCVRQEGSGSGVEKKERLAAQISFRLIIHLLMLLRYLNWKKLIRTFTGTIVRRRNVRD